MAKVKPLASFQIGKNGLTEESILALDNLLQNHDQIRISVLQSSGRNRDSMKKMLAEIVEKIKYPCYTRIIGFTIILSKRGSAKQK